MDYIKAHVRRDIMIYKPYKHLVQYYETDQMGIVHHSNYIAGMGFSNVGLGIVHSMAHPLGALYDTPHGVANAIILPTGMEYNAPATGEKYRDIAKAMGVEGTEKMTQDEYRKAAIDAVKKLAADVGIPADLKDIVKPEDIPFLAQSAYDDACRPGNPRETSVEEITKLYESLI
jgi:lactaldehyde reductase